MGLNLLGTPLTSSDKKFIPEWKQEARSELGHKRFHGAFTGGFQAGYHNTVGSREGWQPSTFTSGMKATVEDYMDEEDLRDRGRQNLVATEEYSKGSTVVGRSDGLGWKLMRSMGWKGNANEKGPADDLLKMAKRRDAEFSSSAGIGVSVLEEEDEDIYAETKEEFDTFIKVTKQPTRRIEKQQHAERGLNILDGFVRAVSKGLYEIEHPPPLVPKDFVPKGLGLQLQEPNKPVRTIEERAKALGETFNSEWKERALSDLLPEQSSVSIELDVTTALSAQRGYMPFQNNPIKDARYRQFLAHFASPNVVALPERLHGMSRTGYEREQEEFVKAANIYKPLSASMASKFVSSKTVTEMAAPKAGLHTPEPKSMRPEPSVPSEAYDPPKASELPVESTLILPYGKDTRSIEEWRPSTNLCKLFHIDTFHNEEQTQVINPVLSLQSLQKIVSGSKFADKVDPDAFKEVEVAEEEEEEVEITENLDRPALKLFKSIFEDSSEEELPTSQTHTLIESESFTPQTHAPLELEESFSGIVSSQNVDTQESITKRPTFTKTKGKRKTLPRLVPVSVIEEPIEVVAPIAKSTTIKPAAAIDDEDYAEIVAIKKKRPDASEFW